MTTTAMKPFKTRRHRDIVFPICNTLVLILIMFITLYPVLNTVAYSFNEAMDAVKGGIGIWPRKFSTDAYASIIKDPAVYKAFGVSVSKTVVTTLLNLFLTTMVLCPLPEGIRAAQVHHHCHGADHVCKRRPDSRLPAGFQGAGTEEHFLGLYYTVTVPVF